MTEAELEAIERDTDRPGPVVELIAEVRRLRGLVKEVEKSAGWHYCDCYGCPWCEAEAGFPSFAHEADCPAFTPEGEVAP